MLISNKRRSTRGGALLAVLWITAALAAIAFSVSTTIRAEVDHVSNVADGMRASYLATGAVDRAVQWILWGPDPRNPDGTIRFWDPASPYMYMHFPSGEAIVQVIPESSKLDLLHANPDDLTRVIAAVSGDAGVARQIADGIIASRGGSAGPSFSGPGASLQEIEDLLLIPGMTPELFYGTLATNGDPRPYPRGGLRDCLSIWGSNGPFDINTASPALLEALGVPPSVIPAVIIRRTEQPFKNLTDASAMGVPLPRLTVANNFVNSIFTLRATARLKRPDGSPSDVVRSASAVVKLIRPKQPRLFDPPQVHVLRFYDDAWSDLAVAPPAIAPGVFPR